MIRKTLLRCLLATLFLLGLGLTGCSDDTQRVITGPATSSVDQLATGNDWPNITETQEDFLIDGFSWPADDESETDLYDGDPDDRFSNDDDSDKPIDNGKGGS